MHAFRPLTLLLSATLIIGGGRMVFGQPLLREGDVEPKEQAEPDASELRRRAMARERAELEEERQLKVQQELMRMQGEQMLAEREKIHRQETMMRYALIIAVAVIAVTILIAYARSRVADESSANEPKSSPPTGL
jgi:hypothetical protein